MNHQTIKFIDEMVFMDRMNKFEYPDVILYHPGHFPELNKQLLDYYKSCGANLILIPNVYNTFLECNEFDYYAQLLINGGIEKEKMMPIPSSINEKKGVEGVIESAFNYLNGTPHKNILLAGKSFFCKRFYLLATIYASNEKVLDVLPLQDHRDIIPTKWTQSEKGRARILNEIEQYAKILKNQSTGITG
ncbi:hypothetical protein F4694_001045 [Bacillus niacini]|uniref:DUF218 domain-containing protein n=1 Tax=Neobacillus niacini TaxID=86668 RepID=A0A852T7W3_9BACI|nr:hypothetical protein [Neobacillus niacini]NYE04301.1 hypothetical protein [Neobacillus niacini]